MTHIVYMPETTAERPSALREQAYLEKLPLELPTLDPSGWKSLPAVKADTAVPNVTMTLRLSIANPVRHCSSHLTVVDFRFIWAVVVRTGYSDSVVPRDT